MERYAKIRDDNLKEQNRRYNEVVENYADIKSLLEEKHKLQNGFNLVLSNEKDFTDYKTNVRSINEKIKQLLKKHSLPENYLEPIYNCNKCQDKGFCYDEGRMTRCSCNVEDGFSYSFEDFNLEIFSKNDFYERFGDSAFSRMEKNLKIAKDYCGAFPNNAKQNLMFYGSSGLGKSFLATCMCSEIKKKGFSAVKVNAFKLIEDFRNKAFNNIPFPKDYYGCDFLVIDDIGTEPMINGITVECLFALINERIERKKATLYITNQSFEHCRERYDDRLASRIFDSINTERLIFLGENLRLRK